MYKKRERIVMIVASWLIYIIFRFTIYIGIMAKLGTAQLTDTEKYISSKIQLFSFIVDLFPIVLILFTLIMIIKIIKGDKI
jgi:hypothetical protein